MNHPQQSSCLWLREEGSSSELRTSSLLTQALGHELSLSITGSAAAPRAQDEQQRGPFLRNTRITIVIFLNTTQSAGRRARYSVGANQTGTEFLPHILYSIFLKKERELHSS